MNRYIALLRAVNVGGTGRLPMAELRSLCTRIGFSNVRTYIASGNVVLSSAWPPARVQARLEEELEAYAGKPVGVVVRTSAEMRSVLEANPFRGREGKFTLVTFLNGPAPQGALAEVRGQRDEEMVLGDREIYVYYGSGVGDSRLRIPAAKAGTARNLNTVTKLVALADDPPV